VFADPAKIHPIEHKGKYFSVPGVFLCEPSPQRTPLLFQAGSSLSGLAFAASHAEAVFFSESRSDVLKPKVKDLRQQAERAGRDPRSLKMFPLMTVVTAATDEEARAKYADYLSYVSYGGALALFGGWSGLDLSGYDPGGPVVNT
jgi:alkanesulfonate monooxygenase SsuD/methylene tetrahydromethanopterin reductase-like flavin-dependent oxidoreductase (luciferase family)